MCPNWIPLSPRAPTYTASFRPGQCAEGVRGKARHPGSRFHQIKKLGDHIALEQKLATDQIAGAEAVRLATLALEIQNIRRDESVDVANGMVKAKTDEYNAERGNAAPT
ncbi:MAG TPA: hypothetical protein VFC21_08770 [Bryobacteraceae bacterium]|nr:hypothetical protein [Bryobacteraceae bacterium]